MSFALSEPALSHYVTRSPCRSIGGTQDATLRVSEAAICMSRSRCLC